MTATVAVAQDVLAMARLLEEPSEAAPPGLQI